jgi:hypothetical protein
MINRQVVLVSRPIGIGQAENFAIREAPVVLPAEGQILARNEFLSVEPAMRGWIADHGNYSARRPGVLRMLQVPEIRLRAPDLILAWQAVRIRTGAGDQLAFNDATRWPNFHGRPM